jgi:hypothetical protein
MSLKKADELRKWLVDTLGIPSETVEVILDQGKAQGYFDDTLIFTGCSECQMPNTNAEFEFCIDSLIQNAGMRDSYQLTVIIRNQAEEPTRIKLGLLRWLYDNQQKTELDYDSIKNNQSTYDWYFYLKMEDRTRNAGTELRTC